MGASPAPRWRWHCRSRRDRLAGFCSGLFAIADRHTASRSEATTRGPLTICITVWRRAARGGVASRAAARRRPVVSASCGALAVHACRGPPRRRRSGPPGALDRPGRLRHVSARRSTCRRGCSATSGTSSIAARRAEIDCRRCRSTRRSTASRGCAVAFRWPAATTTNCCSLRRPRTARDRGDRAPRRPRSADRPHRRGRGAEAARRPRPSAGRRRAWIRPLRLSRRRCAPTRASCASACPG